MDMDIQVNVIQTGFIAKERPLRHSHAIPHYDKYTVDGHKHTSICDSNRLHCERETVDAHENKI